jgi:hypothetical protein
LYFYFLKHKGSIEKAIGTCCVSSLGTIPLVPWLPGQLKQASLYGWLFWGTSQKFCFGFSTTDIR